jgi:hypothetical protein
MQGQARKGVSTSYLQDPPLNTYMTRYRRGRAYILWADMHCNMAACKAGNLCSEAHGGLSSSSLDNRTIVACGSKHRTKRYPVHKQLGRQ